MSMSMFSQPRANASAVRSRLPLSQRSNMTALLLVLAAATLGATAASAGQTPTPVDITVGTSPLSVAVDSATDMLYVANSDSFITRPGTVSVIDGSPSIDGKPNTGKVIATVSVGKDPWGIAVDPKTDMAYVSNRGSNTVSVINGHTDKVVATVGVGLQPVGVGVVPATDTIYVANGGNGKAPGSVSVIDGHTNKAVGSVNVGYNPFGVGVNTASNTVYVGNQGGAGPSTNFAGTVTVIRGTNGIATVNIGGSPSGIAVDSSTNNVYTAIASQDAASTVAVINGANKLVAQIAVQNQFGQGVTFDPGLHAIFVGDSSSGQVPGSAGTLSVINTKTNGEVVEIPVGGNPWGVSVDTNTSRVYLANDTSPGTVGMLDFSHYPIVGGTPPRRITSPILTPTVTTTTTAAPPPPPPTTVPANTPPPAAGTLCALFNAAGGAALGDGYPLVAQGSDLATAPTGACTESNSYRSVYIEKSGPTEYPPAGKPTVSPSGLGQGDGLWELGTPYNPALKIFFKKGGDWYSINDQYLYPATATVAYVAKTADAIIAVARHLYATVP